MTDVVVRRCCLRIRRTAGWAWGASPEALIAAASRGLPRLLAERLPAAGAAAGRAVHIQAPVRVRVPATLAELVALGGLENGVAAAAEPLAQRLGAAIDEALERAVEQVLARADATQEDSGRSAAALAEAAAPAVAAPVQHVAVWRSLRSWHGSGILQNVLVQLEIRALVALHAAVFLEVPPSAGASEALTALVRSKVVASGVPSQPASPLATLRARLALAAALLAEHDALSPEPLCAAVAVAFPRPSDSALATLLLAEAVAERPAGESQELEASRESAQATTSVPSAPRVLPGRAVLELEVPTVLPFLLLPSLQHAGWLDVANTLLTAHGAADDGFALAAALAGKVLDPPERGWLRSPAERRLIAAFAGREEPFGDDVVQASAQRLAPILPLLDDTLRAVLARARRSDAPLVLWRTSGGFSLFDSDGLPLIAKAATPPTCCPGALHIVPAASGDPATLDALDLANLRFITDAPPARGETWRRIWGVPGPLWTNDAATPGPRLAALTADFDDLVAHVAELVDAIETRPAVPRAGSNPLDTTASLAASAALGDIAARLFAAERTTPVLALSRFRSLDAQVRIDAECVRVRVPLGQRHADLLRNGFLTTLPALPWLGGRCLDLGGA